MRRIQQFALAFILTNLAVIGHSAAQVAPPVPNDQVLGGTGGQFERIDFANGGVNLSIPIYKIKGAAWTTSM
jgi:hypothetical protein